MFNKISKLLALPILLTFTIGNNLEAAQTFSGGIVSSKKAETASSAVSSTSAPAPALAPIVIINETVAETSNCVEGSTAIGGKLSGGKASCPKKEEKPAANTMSLSDSMAARRKAFGTPEPKKIEYINFLDLLTDALEIDNGYKIAELGYEGSVEKEKASFSGWYPKADITLNVANQYDVAATGGDKKSYKPTEAKLKITQKVWDFGETTADINTAKLTSTQSRNGVKSAESGLIMSAASTYVGLKKAYEQFKIARDAELKLKKQTGMQDFRVQRGAAVGSNVLQAKSALAGATVARVRATGGFETAKSAFESKFGFVPENIDLMLPIQIPNLLIPKTKDEFKEAVMSNGSQIKNAKIAYDKAMITKNKSYASNFLPKLEFTAEANKKDDASGTEGEKSEYIGKLELTWPIELLGTQVNTYRSDMASGKSAEISYAQAVKGAEDSVNSAWINYQNSSLNRANVQNQVEIANQFLRIAQLEMRRGKGNMMLVMNAQNALVNAKKSLADTNESFAIQVYNMLNQMGSLSISGLEQAAKDEAEAKKKAAEEYRKKVKELQKKRAEEAKKQKTN
jgi:outer membrane protein TolC